MLNPLSFISRIFKSSNDIELVKFRKILEKINSLENDVSKIFLELASRIKSIYLLN